MYVPHLKKHLTQEQLEELEKEINKTEYEKAREPLEKQLRISEEKIWKLEKTVEAYREVVDDLIKSLKNDYIELYIMTKPIKVEWGEDIKKSIDFNDNYKTIAIPIKEEFRNSIYKKIIEKINKEIDIKEEAVWQDNL